MEKPCKFCGIMTLDLFKRLFQSCRSQFYPRERVALLYGDDSGIDDPVIRTQLYRASDGWLVVGSTSDLCYGIECTQRTKKKRSFP